MLDGILDLSVGGLIITALAMTHFTIAGVTLYLHRSQAHQAVDFHPVINHVFRLWLWMSTAMLTKEWVGIHRKHHAKSDQPEDPHSPQILGIKKVLTQGAELYREAYADPAEIAKYSRGTPDDWIERNVYTRYRLWGTAIMLVIDLVLFGALGLTVWAVQMMWIPIFAAGVVNGLGHYVGYRNFENADAATNLVPWGILIGGEELHNNHHAFPGSARLSNKKWEFDIGWMYIKLLSYVGLATIRRVAPTPAIDGNKSSLDMDSVRSLVLNQLNVMADYSRSVSLPTLKELQRSGDRATRESIKSIAKLFDRNTNLLDEADRNKLFATVKLDETLKTVHEFRMRLTDLWERTSSNDTLLANIQEWCAQAEASGIKSLRDFSLGLRGYSMQAA